MAIRCLARAVPAARLLGNCHVRAEASAARSAAARAHRRAQRRAAACLRRKTVNDVRAAGAVHSART